jgi:uncharacterized protein (DUF885 family)
MFKISDKTVRLVVDTGLHAYGWSKAKAIEFIVENSVCSRESAINQV